MLDGVGVVVDVDLPAVGPGELEGLDGALGHFLFNLLFELFKFLFDSIVDVPHVFQEVIAIVLESFLGVVDVRAVLSDVVYGRLDHPSVGLVLSEGL